MTADDIQIFVVTYNRPDLLPLQLESISSQTARPNSITVLDDGPNPETRRVVGRFASRGISYEHTDRPGLWGNVYEAQQRAEREYTLILHDDDQIHPRYVELACAVLNAHDGINLLGCNSLHEIPSESAPFEDAGDTRGWLFDSRGFANFFFNGDFGHFPFFIYRTSSLKRIDVYKYLDYNGAFGKHGDSAFVPLMVGDGKAAMLTSCLSNYGCHPGQAVRDANSLPDARCWARVEAVFHRLMGDDLRTFAGFSYAFRNFRRLRSGYIRRGRHDYTFQEYMRFAREEGAVSPHMDVFRPFCNHATEKLLLKAYRRRIRAKEALLA